MAYDFLMLCEEQLSPLISDQGLLRPHALALQWC